MTRGCSGRSRRRRLAPRAASRRLRSSTAHPRRCSTPRWRGRDTTSTGRAWRLPTATVGGRFAAALGSAPSTASLRARCTPPRQSSSTGSPRCSAPRSPPPSPTPPPRSPIAASSASSTAAPSTRTGSSRARWRRCFGPASAPRPAQVGAVAASGRTCRRRLASCSTAASGGRQRTCRRHRRAGSSRRRRRRCCSWAASSARALSGWWWRRSRGRRCRRPRGAARVRRALLDWR
mmetsp:Transcript_10464/g.34264  ORF Transcript_10464/g.34264 Transcript_10464/m.34264 type:complete len:234 (-) Transcript_10464:69-770(-)